MKFKFAVLFYVIVIAGLAAPISPAAAACLSPGETRAAVSSGEAVSLSQIKNAVRKKKLGDVINAKLCRAGGKLVYKITVLSKNGSAKPLTIDARSGYVP